MRKRRFSGGGLTDAVQTLRSLVNAAATTQKKLPSSTAANAPVLSPLPEGMSTLNSLDSLGSLSDKELEHLQSEITNARATTEDQLRNWEELGKQLKSALDAALLIISLKAEPGVPKRRRTMAPTDESSAEQSSGGSEESGDNELEALAPTVMRSGSPAASPTTDANQLDVGRQVAFKIPHSAVDEWIQCEITRVITPGVRFEVRDPEPDERGNPGKTYQCRLKDIMPLPLPNQPIKPLASGSVVFARYPETTAFYKAKVSSYSAKRRLYYLRFEGEEDAHKEIEVRDTLVLPTARARR